MNLKKWRRVDIQVSLLSGAISVISALCIFFFAYFSTYNDMLFALTERVDSMYAFIDQSFDRSTFDNIESKEDMNQPSYQKMKQLFQYVKQATGVRYLYTAKQNDAGNLVYVIDGLEATAEDFRYPGDLIEPEITDALNRALMGERILPKEIVHTDWGDVFIVYLPIHGDAGKIVGAIGMEFPAKHQYDTYFMLRSVTPIIILLTCFFAILLSAVFFRRISNPHFQDLANTDTLTQLKNRNAYELDGKNACALHRAKGSGLILIDLNGLKRINDTMGHAVGDLYIKSMAEALRRTQREHEVAYRIGGDEFSVLLEQQEGQERFAERLAGYFQETKGFPDASYAIGWSTCHDNTEQALDEAYHNADLMMYCDKKRYYDTQKNGKELELRHDPGH